MISTLMELGCSWYLEKEVNKPERRRPFWQFLLYLWCFRAVCHGRRSRSAAWEHWKCNFDGAGTSEDSWYDQSTKPKLRLPLAEWIKRRQPEASQTEINNVLSFMSKGFCHLPESSLSAAELLEDESRHANKSAMRDLSLCFVLTSALGLSRSSIFRRFFLPQDYSYSSTMNILEREAKTKKKMTQKRAWKGPPRHRKWQTTVGGVWSWESSLLWFLLQTKIPISSDRNLLVFSFEHPSILKKASSPLIVQTSFSPIPNYATIIAFLSSACINCCSASAIRSVYHQMYATSNLVNKTFILHPLDISHSIFKDRERFLCDRQSRPKTAHIIDLSRYLVNLS